MELLAILNACFILIVQNVGWNLISAEAATTTDPLNLLPSCGLDSKSISFYLYNSRNSSERTLIDSNNCEGVFKSGSIVVFPIHGWNASPNSPNYAALIRTASRQEGWIVIAVDWSKAACNDGTEMLRTVYYPFAASHTQTIGDLVADFIYDASKNCALDPEYVILCGHSLGAHVAGFAGRKLQGTYAITLRFIYGLDPAAPGFQPMGTINGLNKEDGRYVQILHTSSFGIYKDIGHADFYPQGGRDQPGCSSTDWMCSHKCALKYVNVTIAKPECRLEGLPWDPLSASPPIGDCTNQTCASFGQVSEQSQPMGTYYINITSLPTSCGISCV